MEETKETGTKPVQQESFYAQVKRALIDKECPFQLEPPARFLDTQPHVRARDHAHDAECRWT